MTKTATQTSKRKTYPAYKPSGMDWVGDIPEHWEVRRLKTVARFGYGDSLAADERAAGPYPVYGSNGVVGEHDRANTKAPCLVIGRKGSFGKVAYSDTPCFAIDTTYFIDSRFSSNDLRWLYYCLQWLRLDSFSKDSAVPGLSREDAYNNVLACCPIDEQRAIAAFLDRETARIDKLIEKKQRQIELLQEKRVALIHEAIQNDATKELRIGYIADQIKRPIKRANDKIYTPIGLYNRGRGIFHKEATSGAELGDSDFFWIESDDLVLSGQFAWEGAVALAGDDDAGCVASHRYPILRGKPNLMETAYLFAFFTTKTGDFLLNEHSRGAAGRNRPLNAGTLLKELVPVPPITAQRRVSELVYFERKFRKIIAASIDLLREYRAALISAAVTGKIDVRKEVA